MSLTVAVVNHGNYLGRGDHFVQTMQRMVARNLRQAHQFVCLKDEGDLPGWWSKIELFRPGRFNGRVLFMDLDSVVVGPLDELAATKGIIHLKDWGFENDIYCSSVMVWDAGEHDDAFTKFTADVRDRMHGDQDWLTELGGWPALPPHLCRSYRHHCAVRGRPPKRCVHVSMHGHPKQTDLPLGHWIHRFWR